MAVAHDNRFINGSFICIRPLPVAAEETAENLFTDNGHRIRSSIEISMPHILRVSSVVYVNQILPMI
jgi:hypothetical protein